MLQFPEVHTTLCPDIVWWSTEDRKIILVDLTVPWGEVIKPMRRRP